MSKKHILFMAIAACLLSLVTTACSKRIILSSPPVYQIPPPADKEKAGPIHEEAIGETPEETKKETPAESKKTISPRMLASLQLTSQGQTFLKNGDADNAINFFEKAISLNPKNGENYYYLAEAWLMKGNYRQATEFNRLADIYLNTDMDWRSRVEKQKKQIDENRRRSTP